jgi:3,4-dihydroxy 2-butanone 4-phosphate synthase / GTP cyclohydrolase II
MRARSAARSPTSTAWCLVSIADLIRYRRRTRCWCSGWRPPRCPRSYGDFAASYRLHQPSTTSSTSRWSSGRPPRRPRRARPGALRVPHRRRLGSLRCDCGPQLQAALRQVSRGRARGRPLHASHEGRGIGLAKLIAAYALQDGGTTRSRRTWRSACPPTPATTARARRSWPTSASPTMRLMTNNPARSWRRWRATAWRSSSGPPGDRAEPAQPRLPGDQARADGSSDQPG